MFDNLYACPYCARSGFTRSGILLHWCEKAPAIKGVKSWRGKRQLTKSEVTKIVVNSTLTPPSKP